MTSVPRLEFIEQEKWTVDIYNLEVDWDEAARSDFSADPAGFLRRQIESAYRQRQAQAESSSAPGGPTERVPVNQILIGEELLGPKGPPPVMHCTHVTTPKSQYSTHSVVGHRDRDPSPE